MHNVLDNFHPAVANWFRRTYTAPTEPQVQAWPVIQSGQHVLIAAPTGSGKTLAAFLAAIDALVRQGVRHQLSETTQVVYVSPLKALSNDIHKNLVEPLAGIREELVALGFPEVEIRTLVRTGDTPQADRDRMRRKPPHILVTTPESLYILLTSESGRKTLANTRTVIVDEIHALAPNKRGVHLVAVPRAAGAHHRQPFDTRGAVGHAEADRGNGELSGGLRRPACEGSVRIRRRGCTADLRRRRHRSCAQTRSRDRGARVTARGGDVGRGVGPDLRAAHRLDPGAQIDAGVRQHPAPGRACGARADRASGRGQGDFAPWQHGTRAAPQCRAEAQARRVEGAGRDLVAGARHRHRSRRPRVSDLHAALHLGSAATGRPFRPRGGRAAQGPDLSVVARRSGGMHGTPGLGASRGAGPPAHPAQAAGRAGAADRRRAGLRRVGRGRAVRSVSPRLAVSHAEPRRVRRSGADAGRGILHAPRPQPRAGASRRGEPQAASAPGTAPDRHHLRRHHPRHCRLQRGAGAGRADHRHRERGLRGGKPGRRRVSARQHVLPHLARGSRTRARGRRSRPAAHHPVLAGRGAGANGRGVGGGIAPAARSRSTG